ncbi:MAG: RecQ family ATP-dependent DNA helicase [Akkermansia sp.]|nr:RecQ family ATP-dependent DNA helicase [Akkermansia sp.]
MELSAGQERRVLALFGKEGWRSAQRDLLALALRGENTLGVLPTGHGKSLCYQAAAVLLGGVSVVVSPLIALMRDQSEALAKLGIAAARFDSTLEDAQRERVLHAVAAGELRLLFVAPESLENHALQEALAAATLSLFVVDEAHCVSEWGHSFRPDYLRLAQWAARRPFRSVMALTATATTRVQRDLARTFRIAPENIITLPPYRPNITRLAATPADRFTALVDFLQSDNGAHLPAIVYCRARKETEALAARLAEQGFRAAGYHAGQPAELREQLQDDFLDNKLQVLTATIAFGMGVDKPDVRSVVHYCVPGSPEAYLQESGRAGRDGAPCTSLVLLNAADILDARNRIRAAEPDAEGVLRSARWMLPTARRVVSFWELTTSCDVPEDVPMRIQQRLEDLHAVEMESYGCKYYKVKPLFPLATILDGRDAAETARLQWLDAHREGEVEDAADAWQCSYAEAMDQLRECEAAGEWKLTLRQQAVCLRASGAADARSVAAELSASYARRREADLERLATLLHMLTAPACINDSLQQYFSDEAMPPCGHCSACLHRVPSLPPQEPAPPCPTATTTAEEMPEFDRPAQRRRFLLGIASPGIMARRLWAHPLYASRTGSPWEEI